MLFRNYIAVAALQATIASATVFHTPEGTLDSATRLEAFLKEHIDEPGFGENGQNVTSPVPTEGTTIKSRSLEARGMGNAIVSNRCDYDIWVWSVDQKARKPV